MSPGEEIRFDKDDAFRAGPSTGQSDEGLNPPESRESLQPENVRVPSVLAVISWLGPDGQEQFIDSRTEVLIQYYTYPINSLFIRLQFEIAQPSRRGTKHLYVFLRPQHLQSLVVAGEQDATPNTTTLAKEEIASDDRYCLSFTMKEPGALVIPKDLNPSVIHLDSSTNTDAQHIVTLMDSLRVGLLSQKSFNLRFPRHTVAEGPLLQLCKAASTPGLLKTDGRLDDLNSLYGGRGGQIMSPDFEDAAPEADIPPSYEATNANVSTESSSSNKVRPRNKKRRREAPSAYDSSVSADSDVTPATVKLLTDRIDSLIDARIDERIKFCSDESIRARINDQFVSHIDRLIDERVGARIDAAVEKFLAPIEIRLTEIQSSITYSKTEFEDIRYEFERDIKDLREETEDLLTTKFDEEISEAKEEIHDYTRAQVEDAKKDIIKQLRKEPLKCVVNMEFDSS